MLFSAFVFVVSYTFAYTLTHYHGSRSKVTGLCLARSPSPVYMQMDGCMNRKTMVSGLCCIALQDENLFYFISSFTFLEHFQFHSASLFYLAGLKQSSNIYVNRTGCFLLSCSSIVFCWCVAFTRISKSNLLPLQFHGN